MSTGWFLDFCLVCDKQTPGGPYCSQLCRLVELDRPQDRDQDQRQGHGLKPGHSRSTTLDSTHSTDSHSTPRLSAVSSQSSLSSLRSHSSNSTLSQELRDYASSFDPVRDLKRRLNTTQ
ncbi:hypothetical protein N7495_001847 [Penicillium taxi]|uniref:uncharacterized protein n=1 Tax=Penicillium taxi TaxID=168475 RepID=UPI002545BA2D|nr:uncharacterized protein N7495_001847 [Penicillium taxi]KAJ5909165.1 hypothetical protein N7495_001847 [Penicillium taxi]